MNASPNSIPEPAIADGAIRHAGADRPRVVILHLAPYPYISGGIDTWLHHFLRRLGDDFVFDVICPGAGQGLTPAFSDGAPDSVAIRYVGTYRGYRSMPLWSVRTALARLRIALTAPTLVLGTVPTMIPAYVLRKLGLLRGTLICSVRGALANDARDLKKTPLFQACLRLAEGAFVRCADVVVANGWDTQQYLRNEYGVSSLVIPNAAEPRARRRDPSDPDLVKLRRWRDEGQRILVHVGTVRRVKGIDYIVEAFRLATERNGPFARLVFVGKGQIEPYKRLCTSAGVEAIFLGEKANVDDYYEAADAVINVSGGSGVSNSLVEALAHGRPVVTWDSMTFTQIVRDGENGVICRLHDSGSLAEGLAKVVRETDAFDSAAIKQSVAHLTWVRVAEDWRALFEAARGTGVDGPPRTRPA